MVLTNGVRILAARSGWIMVASLPAAIAVHGGLAAGPGVRPWFTEVEGRLPLVHLMRLFDALPSLGPLVAVAVVLGVLGNQLLTAGALEMFLVRSGRGILRASWDEGLRHLGPFLRILLFGAAGTAVGLSIIRVGVDALDHIGQRRAWTAATMVILLPALRGGLAVLLFAKIGAWMMAARALTVADGRHRVRRTMVLALRLCWRLKTTWVLPFVIGTSAGTIGAGAVLAAWFQAAPSGATVLGWLGLWVLTVTVQAAIWLWLVRGVAAYVEEPPARDLRVVPDAEFRRRFAAWRRSPPA